MPKLFYKSVFFVSVALLSGCGYIAPYRTARYTLPSTDLSQTVSEATQTPSFQAGEFDTDNWWTFFNDAQLNQLISQAIACNPSMEIAETRIYLAAEKAKYIRANLLPDINFDANVMRRRVGEFSAVFLPGLVDLFTETTIKAFDATYELDIWKKNRNLFWAELNLVQAALAERVEAALILATAVGASYFDLQMALVRLDIAQELLSKKQELFFILNEQFKKGIIAEFFLYETDQQIARLQDSIEILKNEISVSQNSLNALVGNACGIECEGAWLHTRPSATFSSPFPLPSCLPLDLIARRPEIAAQKWRIESACHQIHAAKASFYPNINLLAYFGFQSIEISKLLEAASFNILAGSAVHLPIFDGGRLQANLGTAKESFELAIQEYNQLILTAVQEVSDWISSLKTADRRKTLIDRSLKDAEALYTLTDLRFKNGVADMIPVLNSEIDVLMQKDMAAQITHAKLQSVLGLIKALGGGYYDCS